MKKFIKILKFHGKEFTIFEKSNLKIKKHHIYLVKSKGTVIICWIFVDVKTDVWSHLHKHTTKTFKVKLIYNPISTEERIVDTLKYILDFILYSVLTDFIKINYRFMAWSKHLVLTKICLIFNDTSCKE